MLTPRRIEMARELVPELHDIGKLTEQWQAGGGHQFENFDFGGLGLEPSTPTWRGIFEHHIGTRHLMYPTSPETFFCCLADNLASAASRGKQPSREERSIADRTQRIWVLADTASFPFVSSEEAAVFVSQDPDARAYFRRYGDLLKLRAEETRRPVTSLLTHSELTGKFYRLLSSAFSLKADEFQVQDREQISHLILRKEKEWRLTIAICQPHFLIKPFRARDLGVFAILRQTLDEVKNRFVDNALLVTSERILLVFSSPSVIDDVADTFSNHGFWLELFHATKSLDEFDNQDLMVALGSGTRTTTKFPALSNKIPPPICEACRMAPATRRWREDEDELCEVCFNTRKVGARLTNLARWETEPVAWVHISLDLDTLISTCKNLYAELLKRYGKSENLAEVRFSLVAEFQRDYDAFLKQIQDSMLSRFGVPNIEQLLPSLYCIKLEEEADIMDILRIFHDGIDHFFPKFREVGSSPVRLGISTSAAKFPFFEHWRLLENQEEDVLVHLTGRGELRASMKALPEVLTVAAMPNRSALHKLAEVAKISEDLAKLKMHNREDSDQASYRRLRERLLPFGMDYQSLLTLAKILGG